MELLPAISVRFAAVISELDQEAWALVLGDWAWVPAVWGSGRGESAVCRAMLAVNLVAWVGSALWARQAAGAGPEVPSAALGAWKGLTFRKAYC